MDGTRPRDEGQPGAARALTRAALPMYDWPETRAATRAFWGAIRAAVHGLPALSHPEAMPDLLALWRDPGTALADCCWGTVDLGLCDPQQRLAQRSYDGIPGGEGPLYRSAIVMRAGQMRPLAPGPRRTAVLPDAAETLRWAANSPDSRSGWLSVVEDAGRAPASVLWTGAHRASVRAVAAGAADIAAIDCRSWQLALAHEPAAGDLAVVGWTAPRPGHFFMTGRATPPDIAAALQAALLAQGQHHPDEVPHG